MEGAGDSAAMPVGSSVGTPFGSNRRCGIDTVEIARIERLLAQTPAADLNRLVLGAGIGRQR